MDKRGKVCIILDSGRHANLISFVDTAGNASTGEEEFLVRQKEKGEISNVTLKFLVLFK